MGSATLHAPSRQDDSLQRAHTGHGGTRLGRGACCSTAWRRDQRGTVTCALLACGWLLARDAPADAPVDSATEETTPVVRQAEGRGLLFFPSRPRSNAARLGIGGHYDAVDHQVVYGLSPRIPQFTMDGRLGLGKGWSLTGHLNTLLVVNELLAGGAWAERHGQWAFEAGAEVGVYLGRLNSFGFDALFVAPQYRPHVSVGYDAGKMAISLRGELILLGPERVRVGSVWGGLDNARLFTGHSEMLRVENTTTTDGVWYFGLGVLTTRAYYQVWLLFPDSPALFTYPRAVAGYEF